MMYKVTIETPLNLDYKNNLTLPLDDKSSE